MRALYVYMALRESAETIIKKRHSVPLETFILDVALGSGFGLACLQNLLYTHTLLIQIFYLFIFKAWKLLNYYFNHFGFEHDGNEM